MKYVDQLRQKSFDFTTDDTQILQSYFTDLYLPVYFHAMAAFNDKASAERITFDFFRVLVTNRYYFASLQSLQLCQANYMRSKLIQENINQLKIHPALRPCRLNYITYNGLLNQVQSYYFKAAFIRLSLPVKDTLLTRLSRFFNILHNRLANSFSAGNE